MFCQLKRAKVLIEMESLSCMAREDLLKGFSLTLVCNWAGKESSSFYSHDSALEVLLIVKQGHARMLDYSLTL